MNAEPTGGIAAAGDATVSPSQAGVTQVEQRSERAIINWNSFNVAPGEAVVFRQPSANAIVLNRVFDSNKSSIDGVMRANGRVFVVNPHGVVFGLGAKVNVAGLVATTASILDADFMQGRYEFRSQGVGTASIINEGTIETTAGGRVALMGPNVENRGTIIADRGAVILATGHLFLVDVFGDGLVQLGTALTGAVNGLPVSPPVVQMGDIRVGSGTVFLRRTNPADLVGTLNSIPVGQIANQAVVLPGGAVAFVGSSGQGVQLGAPTWLSSLMAPAREPPSGFGVMVGPLGGGLIDVSPEYSFPLPPLASNVGGVVDPSPVSSARSARLSEFNRLSGASWLWTWKALDDTADAEQHVSSPAALYTTVERSGPSPMAQAASFKQQQPASATPATRGAAAGTAGRYCTVADRAHPRIARGCR